MANLQTFLEITLLLKVKVESVYVISFIWYIWLKIFFCGNWLLVHLLTDWFYEVDEEAMCVFRLLGVVASLLCLLVRPLEVDEHWDLEYTTERWWWWWLMMIIGWYLNQVHSLQTSIAFFPVNLKLWTRPQPSFHHTCFAEASCFQRCLVEESSPWCVSVLACKCYNSWLEWISAKVERRSMWHCLTWVFHEDFPFVEILSETKAIGLHKGCWWLLPFTWGHMGVSENSGTPKSSILIGFSIINHPFWGTPIFGNTHIHHILAECLWIDLLLTFLVEKWVRCRIILQSSWGPCFHGETESNFDFFQDPLAL